MKRFLALTVLVFVGVMAWRVGGRISADAVGVAVGVVFGVLASVPAALLVLAAARRGERRDPAAERAARRGEAVNHTGYPPVVVVAPPGYPNQAQQTWQQHGPLALPHMDPSLPASHQRQFHIVGEEDEWVEEWRG